MRNRKFWSVIAADLRSVSRGVQNTIHEIPQINIKSFEHQIKKNTKRSKTQKENAADATFVTKRTHTMNHAISVKNIIPYPRLSVCLFVVCLFVVVVVPLWLFTVWTAARSSGCRLTADRTDTPQQSAPGCAEHPDRLPLLKRRGATTGSEGRAPECASTSRARADLEGRVRDRKCESVCVCVRDVISLSVWVWGFQYFMSLFFLKREKKITKAQLKPIKNYFILLFFFMCDPSWFYHSCQNCSHHIRQPPCLDAQNVLSQLRITLENFSLDKIIVCMIQDNTEPGSLHYPQCKSITVEGFRGGMLVVAHEWVMLVMASELIG